jgi:hypothetical protein
MGPDDHNRFTEGWPHNDWLDAALRQYGEAEPRPGLEERILANVRAEQGRSVAWTWWPWTAVALAAIAIVVAGPLAWRSGKTGTNSVAHNPLTATPSGTQVTNSGSENQAPPEVRVPAKKHTPLNSHSPARVAASPRLEQFPSPQPLSEQETILASYVAQFQEQAVLVARARTQELQRDRAEEMGDSRTGVVSADSDRQPNETENR